MSDLKRFLEKRQCLNVANSYLIYLFHFIQSAGILTTSIAAASDDKKLIWKNDHKQTFIKCYKINKLKSFYKLDDNIITIYKHSKLKLNFNQITSIPSELGQLINLQ